MRAPSTFVSSLSANSDGVASIASTKEVWVTSPEDRMLTIDGVRDPAHPKQTAHVEMPGAVDQARDVPDYVLSPTD